ncbi:alanine racemase [Methylobacterium brachiatum]|uniref:alanine racemase n=1 Tax=Methylobacterium brachiatum TaxID=269660 RepID=UPI001FE1024B|nr:alanine racemase [Methylobacterium brachiatum]
MRDREATGVQAFDEGGNPHAGAILTVNLDAIAANYRLLSRRLGTAECAAVLKADAYGLGAARVAPVLSAAGCRTFFVAHLDEGIALRRHVPREAAVWILHGAPRGAEAECLAHGLIPVLNTPGQLARWAALARARACKLPGLLQVDSGMSRFGLSPAEIAAVADRAGEHDAVDWRLVMSHLACADAPDSDANPAQRSRFEDVRRRLPPMPASLAASSGIFLGADYHYDVARPGAALFGVAPVAGRPNPLKPVVKLEARVLQVRDVPAGTAVGYGYTARTAVASRLATVAIGYADGFLRSASGRGAAWAGGVALPILGRVSMDSIVVDASALPAGALAEDDAVEIIGPHRSLDAVAADAGTIGYEVLTGLGDRFDRRYIHRADATAAGPT